jgi:hypothetical protein
VRAFCGFVLAALALVASATALALSCAPPRLDDAAIEAAVAIFEGTAGEKRALSFRERAAIHLNPIEKLGGAIEDLRVYRFTVTSGWKGMAPGQGVEVLFNSHWGDGFAVGESYLVVSPRQVEGLFWAPLCGNTVHASYAAKNGDLATLEQVVGIGHHMKVRIEDRACQRAEECSTVQTHCGGCSCGTPVASTAVGRYEAQFDALCAVIRIAERCEMDCPRADLSCREGVCVGEPK